jgi:hypothetical protein
MGTIGQRGPQGYRSKLKLRTFQLDRKAVVPTPRVSDLRFKPAHLNELFQRNAITNQNMSEILRNVKVAIGQRHRDGYLVGKLDLNHIFVNENLNTIIDWPSNAERGRLIAGPDKVKAANEIYARLKPDYVHLSRLLQGKFHLSNVQALVFLVSIISEYRLDTATNYLLIQKLKKELFPQL